MLKSLELFGFKSFADRTLFEFSPGISCVVGPNGSGKSNVVDAMKWLLGDQSAKSLRGQDMLDVIFNGSAGRRPSGFAEATLTFDNSRKLLPSDAAEVRIGRRLYQSGDSEYLLNGAVVRLKDVRDLLMGTGAGTAAYSIIEQGRVDQILQANPATRRFVFEEASGISKFKARRVEAERRLERVAQNLVRLTDLVDQAEAQLNATRSQASKAARFREISQELRTAWTGLAADETRRITEEHETLQLELESRQQELEQVRAEIEQVEARKREVEQELAQAEDAFLKCEQAASNLRERVQSETGAIRHQNHRLDDISADISRVRQQALTLRQQSAFAAGELNDLHQLLAAQLEKFQEFQRQIQSRSQKLKEFSELAGTKRRQLSVRQSRLTELSRQQTQTDHQLTALRSQLESLAADERRRRQIVDQITTQLDEANAELEQVRQSHRQQQLVLQERQEECKQAQADRLRLDAQFVQTEQLVSDLREKRSIAHARWVVLEELERRHEGIAIGARDILRRAVDESTAPWTSVIGLVRDLLDVPLDLAPIIDAALAERAQWIALTTLQEMLDYLHRGGTAIDGRVGFVSTAQQARSLALSLPVEWQGRIGVYGRADLLVQEAEHASGLAACVLGDTWIVENLAIAQELVQAGPPGIRAATLQGEVVTQEERLFVGTLPHESSIISRKSELRILRNEILQVDRSLQDALERQDILARNLSSRSESAEMMSQELQNLTRLCEQQGSQLAMQEREVQRLQHQSTDAQSDCERLREQKQLRTSEEQKCLLLQAELHAAAESLEGQLRGEETELAEIEQLLRETGHQVQLEQLEITSQAERLNGLQTTQTRLERDQRQREQQAIAARTRLNELLAAHRQTTLETLAAQSRHSELALEQEQSQTRSLETKAVREQLRAGRGVFAQQEQSCHQRSRDLSDQIRRTEFELQKLQHHAQSLQSRIQEEYQLTLDDLLASGYSAYRDFLVERYGPEILPSSDGSTNPSGNPADWKLPPQAPAFAEIREELEARVDRLRRKLKALGSVNTDALEHLEELEQHHSRLAGQLQDLQQAKAALEDIIRRINVESRRLFMETFEVIRKHFQELFRKLFGGGDADILLENAEDVLECGIEIVARPPGKELRSISLLSGGEKTMTAVGLLFAMFKSKPSPYCILDEVDAALDEANVDRYVSVLREFVSMTQFVVITHRKRTMTAANVLYGVTMEQAGVSKKISVRFEDVRDNGEIRKAA